MPSPATRISVTLSYSNPFPILTKKKRVPLTPSSFWSECCYRISWNKQDFFQPTSLRDAFCQKWILPRPKKQSTGLFLTLTSFGPVFRIPMPIQIRKPTLWVSFPIWSEYRDSNPRPLGPEPSAIPNLKQVGCTKCSDKHRLAVVFTTLLYQITE